MINKVIQLVRKASEKMLTDTFEIAQKEGFANIVTSSDLAVQNALKEGLAALLPAAASFARKKTVISWERNTHGSSIPSTAQPTTAVASTNAPFA